MATAGNSSIYQQCQSVVNVINGHVVPTEAMVEVNGHFYFISTVIGPEVVITVGITTEDKDTIALGALKNGPWQTNYWILSCNIITNERRGDVARVFRITERGRDNFGHLRVLNEYDVFLSVVDANNLYQIADNLRRQGLLPFICSDSSKSRSL